MCAHGSAILGKVNNETEAEICVSLNAHLHITGMNNFTTGLFYPIVFRFFTFWEIEKDEKLKSELFLFFKVCSLYIEFELLFSVELLAICSLSL